MSLVRLSAIQQPTELKRVIAAFGDRVVMEETLAGALASLFRDSSSGSPPQGMPVGPVDDRAREALSHYERAIERLKAGDWGGFGVELDALRPLLDELGQRPSGR
jgi:uncharacterized protein